MFDEKALVEKLKEIDCKLDEIKIEQTNIKKTIEKNNKILMQRINKMEEYNEINDMRSKVTNNELYKIEMLISEINEKLY